MTATTRITICGKHRQALKQAGAPIGELVLLIAAHAQTLGLTLGTNNTREFERIEGLTTRFNKDTPKYETCVACVERVSTRHGRLKSALQHAILGGCGRCFTLTLENWAE